jgi:hypothetical protein
MAVQDFGVFANVMAVALALAASFASLVPRAIGRFDEWSGLTDNPPSILTLAPARVAAVVVMAVAYVTIDDDNLWMFGGIAGLCALFCIASVFRFDRLRRIHVAPIPLVSATGEQLKDSNGRVVEKRVIIGTEEKLRPEVAEDLRKARSTHGGVSLRDFMAGYGSTLNDPASLWDDTYLAGVGSRIARWLTAIVLFGVLALYLAALVVDASS